MRIIGLGTAVPPGSVEQAGAARLGARLAAADDRQRRVLTELFRRAGVARRHSVLIEPGSDAGRQDFYAPRQTQGDHGPDTAARMREYEAAATALAAQAAEPSLSAAATDPGAISHLITVSCTGLHAPGVDIGLIETLRLRPDVRRAHVGFMGCHGMFNALELARAIVRADDGARVLVAAVELCSLHYQYGWDPDRLVANALFGDGAAAMVCAGADASDGARLNIDATASTLLPDSAAAMTWRIGAHGFEMTLAPTVPALIREHVGEWLAQWLHDRDLDLSDIRHWAVHPGGPRVLSAFEAAVGLDSGGLVASRQTLARYGNMSSVTVAFILEQLLQTSDRGRGLAVGFGPGMVAEAFLFQITGS